MRAIASGTYTSYLMLKLVIIDDEGRKTPVPLVRAEITVGRAEGNTIRLTERNVSRRHASIYRNGNGYRVADTSRYGIKKNGRLIEGDAAFDVGDVLIVGDYRVTLIEEDEQPTPETTLPRAVAPRRSTDDLAAARPEATEADTEVSTLARLVCLTEPFVGSEFVFMGDELVLGTGDSCDLIIQHDSIADRHAKFTRDGDTYAVEALTVNIVVLHNDSAPGKPLKGRDLVRIGDLVFRYLEAGAAPAIVVPAIATRAPLDDEDYRSNTGWWVTLAAALLLGGLVFFLWPRETVVPVEPPPAPEISESAAAFAAGQAAMREGEWDAAAAAFESVPRSAPEGPRAAAHRELVESERGYATHYNAAVIALAEQRHRDALSALNEIPQVSYYASRALAEQLELRAVDGVVGEELAKSRAAQEAGDLGRALEVVLQIRPLAPQHRGLTNRIEQLRALQRGEVWPTEGEGSGAAMAASPGVAPDANAEQVAAAALDPPSPEAESVAPTAAPEVPVADPPRATPPPPQTQDDRAAIARAEAARITAERQEQDRVARQAAAALVEQQRLESERRAAEAREAQERQAAAAAQPEVEPQPEESRSDRAESLRQEAARAGIAQDYRRAIELLEEAAALNSRDARIQLSLFSNYRRLGNRARATRAVQRYLELRPDAPEREEFETWLEMNAP